MKMLKKSIPVLLVMVLAVSAVALNKRMASKLGRKKRVSKMKFTGKKTNRLRGSVSSALKIRVNDLRRKPRAILFARNSNSDPVVQIRYIRTVTVRGTRYKLFYAEAFKNGRYEKIGELKLHPRNLVSPASNRKRRDTATFVPGARGRRSSKKQINWRINMNSAQAKQLEGVTQAYSGRCSGSCEQFFLTSYIAGYQNQRRNIVINGAKNELRKTQGMNLGARIAHVYSGSRAPKNLIPALYVYFVQEYIPYP